MSNDMPISIAYKAILMKTGLRVWQNKSLDQLTDQECEECLKAIQGSTGIYYVPIRNWKFDYE